MGHETAHDDANAACLPRDVLANILLRLTASDLRRLRRVCKEWRAVISDPIFVNEHMDHGPSALTHSIVFLRGRSAGADGATAEPHNGHGFLFDEHWRLVATFTAGESEDLVGTCNGLLCFLDVHNGAINVVEPFTGESLSLTLPPQTETFDERGAYCFGFDRSKRRYKIFHQGLDWGTVDTTEQDLYVYTIGGGSENRRRVQVTAGAEDPEVSCGGLVFADGWLYWSVETMEQLVKLVRFDLATEEITSESIMDFLPVGDHQDTAFHVMTNSESGANLCVMTVGWQGDCDVFLMEEGDRWARDDSRSGVTLSLGQHIVLPQALQRGHLLLDESREDGMYIHPMPPANNDDLGSGKLLLKIGGKEDKEPAKCSSTRGRGVFVPALLNQVPPSVRRVPQDLISTFCYAPPVSHAPLSHRCRFQCGSPQTLAENKVTNRS